jgi:sulfatase maturation enzyme AslB (radical SAM superfamily)
MTNASPVRVPFNRPTRLAVAPNGDLYVSDGYGNAAIHRFTADGQPSSIRVQDTMARLIDAGQDFRVVMVVQPRTVESLSDGMDFLYERGVRQFDPSLNLWTTWTRADGERLKDAIRRAADFWGERLPDCSVSWFDEKAARASGVPLNESARCGFGHIEIAVTPAGNLYPCERLVAGWTG